SVLFQFQRAPIADNTAFAAGGMRFTVEVPFERLHVSYAGPACLLREPLAMADPRRAFRENPFVPVEVELAIEGIGPMFGGEPSEAPPDAMEFARGHYEQHHRAVGRVAI